MITIQTRESERRMRRLAAIAGSRAFVIRALIELRDAGEAPTLGRVIDYLLERRDTWHREAADARRRGSSTQTR